MRAPDWFVLDHRPPHAMPKPAGRLVVHLEIDLEPFRAAMSRAAAGVADLANATTRFLNSPGFRRVAAAVEADRQHQADLAEIRDLAHLELISAECWLDLHVDDVRADLGLPSRWAS